MPGSRERARKIKKRLVKYAGKHHYKQGSAKYNAYVYGKLGQIARRKKGIAKK